MNIALFGSSAWHLGRKIKADYIDEKKKPTTTGTGTGTATKEEEEEEKETH